VYRTFSRAAAYALLASLVTALFAACARPAPPPAPQAPGQQAQRVGIVLSVGGRGDKSFNDAAIRGLDRAKAELGIDYRAIEPREMASDEAALTFLAREGYNLVIGVGFLMEDSLRKVAGSFPNTKFAIIDAVVDAPNVASLVFKEHEGSFLAGALAALTSRTGTVGFIGGMNMPLIHRFEGGFTAGAKHVNPNVKVLSHYAGDEPKAFNDPARGKELALSQYRAGADVIYHASGGTGAGVFEAAKEQNKYAIGVDSNQNWMQPGNVIASMLKRVDVAVFESTRTLKENRWEAGTRVFGLKENGVGLTGLEGLDPEETAGTTTEQQAAIRRAKETIPAQARTRIGEIRQNIINETIKVPDWITGKPPVS
jgi:basic membrane protein A and related proteins